MKKLNKLIRTYKDFPKKGIDFKDVLEILHEPESPYLFSQTQKNPNRSQGFSI